MPLHQSTIVNAIFDGLPHQCYMPIATSQTPQSCISQSSPQSYCNYTYLHNTSVVCIYIKYIYQSSINYIHLSNSSILDICPNTSFARNYRGLSTYYGQNFGLLFFFTKKVSSPLRGSALRYSVSKRFKILQLHVKRFYSTTFSVFLPFLFYCRWYLIIM